MEALRLVLKHDNFKMLLAGIFRPIHYTFEKISTFYESSDGNVQLFIMDDFNLPDLKWPLLDVDVYKSNNLHKRFIDMYVNSNLYRLATKVTKQRNNEQSL